ncbi:MAG: PorP/SprF family type IX secretion system membrane protein [Tenuifilaceae bacterium]
MRYLLNKFSLLIIAVSFSCSGLFGQDISFSQLFFNHLYLNPAYAGASKHMRLGIVYRNQWMSAKMPYSTYGVSFDRTIQSIKSGVGINIINDVQGNGVIQRTTADFIYAYGVQTSYNSHLRGGIQASLMMKNQNLSNLVFPDMISSDGTLDPMGNGLSGRTNFMYDFSVGLAGDWDIFYGGIAVHHLLQPVEANVGGQRAYLPRKYTAHLGCELNLYKWYRYKEKLLFSPNIIYIKQLEYQQVNIGFYFTRFQVVAGIWLKENLDLKSHTFVFTAGYSNDQFRFGYSYDFGIYNQGFRGLATSTHEVTFGWNFEYKKGKKKFRYIKCPKF